tara:strand:- start:41 stop:511 length:471 start_codon:yes stop_codon:yes gene_type:complete
MPRLRSADKSARFTLTNPLANGMRTWKKIAHIVNAEHAPINARVHLSIEVLVSFGFSTFRIRFPVNIKTEPQAESASIIIRDNIPIKIAADRAVDDSMLTIPRADIADNSRIPHPPRLIGRLEVNITMMRAAAIGRVNSSIPRLLREKKYAPSMHR